MRLAEFLKSMLIPVMLTSIAPRRGGAGILNLCTEDKDSSECRVISFAQSQREKELHLHGYGKRVSFN